MSKSGRVDIRARLRCGNPLEHNNVQDSHADWLIGMREKLLDKLSGAQAGNVLNDSSARSDLEPGVDLAAELKRALDRIKSTATDESGLHVNYAYLRASAAYQEFRTKCSPHLRNFDPAGLASRKESLAFWINLYNVLVVDSVIALGIQKSVIEGRLGLLTFFRCAAYNVGGFRLSLEEIEHGILRGNRGHPIIPGRQIAPRDPRMAWVIWPLEPRIHFALNCASKSCPPIQVYSANHLEVQLELAAKNYVDSYVELLPNKNLLIVPRIFQWYKDDFGMQAGVLSFLIDHLPDDGRRTWLLTNRGRKRIRFAPYDWGINTI